VPTTRRLQCLQAPQFSPPTPSKYDPSSCDPDSWAYVWCVRGGGGGIR
jgi:hypothetical protein